MIKEIDLILEELTSVYNLEDYKMITEHYKNDIEYFTSKELIKDIYNDIDNNADLNVSIKYLTDALKEFTINWNDNLDILEDILIDYEIATAEEIRIAYHFNGTKIDTLNSLIYLNRGYHDIMQLNDYYDMRIDFKERGLY